MDSQYYIEYELVDPVTNQRHYTTDRDEALGYLEEGWLVWEHHNTICQPSLFTSTRVIVTMRWNNNPDFQE